MKKIMENKRLLITLIAGLLVLTAAFGAGTWAWFTDNATAEGEGEFWMAYVGVEADEADFNAYDFYPGAGTATLAMQKILETNGSELATRMSQLYAYHNIISALDAPTTVNDVQAFLIKNPFNKQEYVVNGKTVSTFVWNPTPGSILEAKYSFTSNASIPVYFRVNAAELLEKDSSGFVATKAEYVSAVLANIKGDRIAGDKNNKDPDAIVIPSVELIDGGDGWFYCPIPLSPEYGWKIEIINVAYLYGEANGNALQTAHISFTNANGITGELIQATNNAVFMVSGWSDVAADFVPYVKANLYNAYLADFAGSYPEIIIVSP